MFLAYEFGDPSLKVIEELSPQEVGRWLAFFKRKTELETPKKKVTDKTGHRSQLGKGSGRK